MRYFLICFWLVLSFINPVNSIEFQTTKNIKKDWSNLEKLLNDEKLDIGEKRKFTLLFVKEYGYEPQKNPYIYQLIKREYIQFDSVFLRKTIRTEKEARDILIKGNYLFLADGPGGVLIFDISKPTKPEKISEIKDVVYAASIYVDEQYLYIAQGQAGFSVWDIGDISNPKIVCSQYANVEGIYAKNSYVYTVGGDNSLIIFDISNPSSVKKIASYRKLKKAIGVTGHDNYVYVADSDKRLYKFKFVDNKLSLLSSIDIEGKARNFTQDNNYLYVASLGKGVFIIDKNSFKIKAILKEEAVEDVFIQGKNIYTITRESGAKMWEFKNTARIDKTLYFQIEGYGESIAAKEDVIYIANSTKGLLLIYPNPNKPKEL